MSVLQPGEILTVGKDEKGTPFVRYQLLPASIHGHRVNVVYIHVHPNSDITYTIPSEFFHCIRCKLMGTISTLQQYSCV